MATTRLDRLTRIRMLLGSYLDARPGLVSRGEDRVKTQPGSSIPHMGYLWSQGSYDELEEALSSLSYASGRRVWRAFIWQPDRRRRSVQLIYRQKQAARLNQDLRALSSRMPRRIRVPKDVLMNWADYVQTPTEKEKAK